MKLDILVIGLFLIVHSSSSTPTNKNIVFSYVKIHILNLIKSNLNGTECGASLDTAFQSLYNSEWWAIKMLDANSKINSGLLQGNRRTLGSYDQCMSLQNAQYCIASVVLKKNTQEYFYQQIADDVNLHIGIFNQDMFSKHLVFHNGFCVPKSCIASDLNKLLKGVLKTYNLPIDVQFSNKMCYSKDKKIASNRIDIYIFLLFVAIIIVEIISTIYDLYLRRTRKQPNIFVSLSLYTNTKKLFSMHCENASLICLYGIRAISMIWVILGHLLIGEVYNSTNIIDALSELVRYKNAVFIAAPYVVDTFLAVSGLLVVYVYLKYSEKMQFYWSLFYLHRLLRLGPALLATVFINMSIVKYVIDSPFAFNTLKVLQTTCENSLWHTLLFASNLLHQDDRCLPHSWYLAIDTQLYLLAPVLIYYIKRSGSKIFLAVCAICVCSFAYTWTLVLKNYYGFIIVFENADDIYTNVICRMPAWFIGTYFGYLLYKHNIDEIRIPKITNIIMWFLCICTLTTLILYQVSNLREDYNVYRSAFLNTFSRPLWSLSVCYIIFSCCTGHGGLVNTFLSHPVFIVLGKLSYSMYLIHVTTTHIVLANQKQTGYFSTSQLLFNFCGHFAVIFIGAVMLCLVFETPVVSFLRHLEARKYLKKR